VEPADRFGQNLRRCRRVADLSQEQLGLRAGLHRTEIGLLERGARIPRIDTLLKLAAALAVSPRALLVGIVWEPGETQPGRFKSEHESDRA
jgi:transcriptional regulator with XRE-family HTH domain